MFTHLDAHFGTILGRFGIKFGSNLIRFLLHVGSMWHMFFCMAAALLSLYLAVEQDLSTWPGGMREAIRRPPRRGCTACQTGKGKVLEISCHFWHDIKISAKFCQIPA